MKENTGSLFKNDKKESETHPDYKGSAKINNEEYWMSSWINKSADGKTYMSFKFKIKDVQPSVQAEAKITPDVSSEIPF